MAGNTNTITKLVSGQSKRVVYFTLVSDGSEETDLVIYDSSDWGGVDTLTGSIQRIQAMFHILDETAVDVRADLQFDASTDVHAISLPKGRPIDLDFRHVGGLKNYSGTGRTGDITLTTTGLESGDTISLVLEIRPNG